MFEFNKERATTLLQNQIRYVREDFFKQLDIKYMRAVESGDTALQSEISVQKQTLRDLTNIDIGSFTTREEWLTMWPEDILGPNPYI
jgi:arabinogalactan endo-1,4-beta-galactosidase